VFFQKVAIKRKEMVQLKNDVSKTVALLVPKVEKPIQSHSAIISEANMCDEKHNQSIQTAQKSKYTPICYIIEDITPPKNEATVLHSMAVTNCVASTHSVPETQIPEPNDTISQVTPTAAIMGTILSITASE
jgi:hypothetical protein